MRCGVNTLAVVESRIKLDECFDRKALVAPPAFDALVRANQSAPQVAKKIAEKTFVQSLGWIFHTGLECSLDAGNAMASVLEPLIRKTTLAIEGLKHLHLEHATSSLDQPCSRFHNLLIGTSGDDALFMTQFGQEKTLKEMQPLQKKADKATEQVTCFGKATDSATLVQAQCLVGLARAELSRAAMLMCATDLNFRTAARGGQDLRKTFLTIWAKVLWVRSNSP